MSRFIMMSITFIALATTVILLSPVNARAGLQLDLESGIAESGYNDVRYPGATGTMLSLSRDLTLDRSLYWRARASYTFGGRHTLSLLVAPLRLEGSGVLSKDVTFGDATFPTMTAVTTKYRFDSYRLTYRYDFVRDNHLRLGIGFTGKIRDAAISIQGGGLTSEKANTGFVPLINFRADIGITSRIGFLIEGDALAAPQGRAEDILAAVTIQMSREVRFKLGYRILEGGADNDEIYTFALVNYLVLGVVWQM
jgi:hypothetical protein